MADWYATRLPLIQQQYPPPLPPSSRPKGPTTPPTASTSMLTPPPTHRQSRPKPVSEEDVEDFVKVPHTIIGRKFRHSPPDSEDADLAGVWSVARFSVDMVDGRVESTYHVTFELFGQAHIPMGPEELRELLAHSMFDS